MKTLVLWNDDLNKELAERLARLLEIRALRVVKTARYFFVVQIQEQDYEYLFKG